jgi:hypothetical protein
MKSNLVHASPDRKPVAVIKRAMVVNECAISERKPIFAAPDFASLRTFGISVADDELNFAAADYAERFYPVALRSVA